MLRETYMNIKDFMLPRNSGTPPVKLLFDKSLLAMKLKFFQFIPICIIIKKIRFLLTMEILTDFLVV